MHLILIRHGQSYINLPDWDGGFIDMGKITEAAARFLGAHLGERQGLEAGVLADEVPTFVTPNVLVRSVEAILGELPARCTYCQAAAWKSDDGAKVVCGACGKPAAYPDGDTLTKRWIHEFEEKHHLFRRA